MKVHQNSWHCKLVTSYNEGQTPKSLCCYFWCFLAAILTIIIFVSFCGMALWFALAPIWQPLLGYFGKNMGNYGPAKMALILYAVFGTIGLVSYLGNKWSIVRVITAALIAMKDKMCPLIEVIGDDNER